MPNRLANETSPYLLQHAENPVDWRPWGPEALAEAREQDKPLLVSIGYSACHWCHVMERESFEDPEVAAVMNDLFVPVKVDREERPDVDAIYMEAVQAMTGHGGWPLNVFVTPEQIPFFGGTYFPPTARQGMPAWRDVLERVAAVWEARKDEIRAQSDDLARRLQAGALLQPSRQEIDATGLDTAVENLRAGFDTVNGGFGGPPKFPQASVIEFLLRRRERDMSLATLRKMADGGIHDQVGGGFHRYTVDARWIVPHFEKMLYDNALLARAYLHGFQVSGDKRLRDVACDTLDWILRDMRAPDGGFYAALDADSEGVEGKYYVWTKEEIRAALSGLHDGAADHAIAYYGVTDEGNFEGSNILVRAGDPPEDLDLIRGELLCERDRRVRPGLDDKRLTSWNALTIAALAEAGAVLERGDLVDAAVSGADFVLTKLREPETGRLLRTYSRGQAKLAGYLEDHAFMLEALLALYEATFEPRYFRVARELAEILIAHFADPEHGGFFTVADDHEQLAVRRKELEDSPIPSGQSSAAFGLLRLGALTGEHRYIEHAEGVMRLLHELIPRHPTAFAYLAQAVDWYTSPTREVALAGDDVSSLARVVRSAFRPHLVLAAGEPDGVPLMEGRTPVDGRPAAYVCERFACRQPVTEPEALAQLLDAAV
jgi:uncharacterized protein YyaL (SSP411 family)